MSLRNTSKKTILILNSSVSGGGAGKQLVSLVRGLDSNYLTPHVVLPSDGVIGSDLKDGGATLHYEPLIPERFGRTYLSLPKFFQHRWIERLVNVALFPVIIWRLRRLVRELEVDLIFANHLIHFPIGLGLARFTGTPIVFHSREILSHLIARWYFRWLAQSSLVRAVFCSSRGTSKLYEPTGKTRLVYDRLALKQHCTPVKPKLRKEFNISSESTIIGFLGRFVEWKGIPLLIEAFGEVAKQEERAVLVIMGKNDPGNWKDLSQEYKALAQSLGIEERVIFTGFKDDPRGYVSDFDIFVLPSIEPEPFGMVTIEAMAFGKPPVVSAHGGTLEIVTHEKDGLHFRPGDKGDLQAQLVRLLEDPELREKLGTQARKTVFERFDSTSGDEEITEAILSIFNENPRQKTSLAS